MDIKIFPIFISSSSHDEYVGCISGIRGTHHACYCRTGTMSVYNYITVYMIEEHSHYLILVKH